MEDHEAWAAEPRLVSLGECAPARSASKVLLRNTCESCVTYTEYIASTLYAPRYALVVVVRAWI